MVVYLYLVFNIGGKSFIHNSVRLGYFLYLQTNH